MTGVACSAAQGKACCRVLDRLKTRAYAYTRTRTRTNSRVRYPQPHAPRLHGPPPPVRREEPHADEGHASCSDDGAAAHPAGPLGDAKDVEAAAVKAA